MTAGIFWLRQCMPGRCSSRAKRLVCSFNGRIPDCGWRTISTTKASPKGLTESPENAPGAMTDETAEVRLQPGTRTLPFGTMELTLDESGLSWGGYRLERFIPTTALEVRGLRNRYFRPGIGASLAASLAPGAASARVVGSQRIGHLTKVPVTALLRLEDVRASLASGRVRGRLEVYAADHASTVMVDGQAQPLEYDPTAALAYQLDKSPLYAMEIAAFLRAGVFAQQIPRDRTQDGLFMLHPYSPGKIPLVLVHGTASSPARWADLVNEVENDRLLWDEYQIWLFLYNTGNPIGYSGGLLRRSIERAVQELDPEGTDEALRRMVVIGHSQGGLLAKLTAVDSGSRFWSVVCSKPPREELDLDPDVRKTLKLGLFFTPEPFVKRVVFVCTPHRGSYISPAQPRGSRVGLRLRAEQPDQVFTELARNEDKILMRSVADRLPTSITT